jgi:hypothetical protein
MFFDSAHGFNRGLRNRKVRNRFNGLPDDIFVRVFKEPFCLRLKTVSKKIRGVIQSLFYKYVTPNGVLLCDILFFRVNRNYR